MRVGVLQTGAPPAVLERQFGGYGAMTAGLLDPSHEAVIHDVTSGALPDPLSCGAFLITGSPAGVYEDRPWIPPLLDWLRAARGRAKLVGICFGHQAMGQAFGGQVTKAPNGWGIGVHRYEVRARAPWMDDTAHVDVPCSHQDQVVEAAPDARVVAASAFTPFAGLDYGNAISFQFHPEFEPAFGRALIEAMRARHPAIADPALSVPALASYDRPNDSARVRGWIGRFLA